MSQNTGKGKKRKRLIFGCQRCRARHLKCDIKSASCHQCKNVKVKCIRESNIRFRGVSKNADLAFPRKQTWLTASYSNIEFQDETKDIIQSYLDSSPSDSSGEQVDGSSTAIIGEDPGLAASMSHSSVGSNEFNYILPAVDVDPFIQTRNDVPEEEFDIASFDLEYNVPYVEVINDHREPHSSSTHTKSSSSSSSDKALSSPDFLLCNGTSRSERYASLTTREAVLMRNFIDKMALYADVTDPQRHFEIEVPRRALYQPVLKLAILAFSSRQSGSDETESLQYHNECLQLLIPRLSETGECVNEDILSAIAILRGYEEMDVYDSRCHLIGTTRILNSISTFASSGGLGEAAAWLCLRQDIYVSLVSQQPLKTQLDSYRKSRIFEGNDDVSWANQMVFLLAEVLSLAFLSDHNTNSLLAKTDQEVEEWNLQKPASFAPIRYLARNIGLKRAFPDVWLLSPFHVVALQYYHIAKLVLTVSTRQVKTAGYDNLRQGRKIEKTVRSHLLMIIGLAASNSSAENSLFTARHCLSVWGGVLQDSVEREAAVSFLINMGKRTGWRTHELVQSLQEQWDEDVEITESM